MKRLPLDVWEKKHITGSVKRFDQKNTMTRRVYADPVMKKMLPSWSATGDYKDEPGYTQQDYALRWAPRSYHAMISVLNDSKPNPSPIARAVKALLEGSSHTLSYAYSPQKGVKIDAGNPKALTADIKKTATFYGADLVGVCRLDRRWVYSHTCDKQVGSTEEVEYKPLEIPEAFQYAVIMGFETDYDMMRHRTTLIGGAAADLASTRMTITGALMTAFIKFLGYHAIDCTIDDVAITVPMAIQAGLGELGRHGMLISPQFGPRVRIAQVITDLPLIADLPIEFGVTEFCEKCKKCAIHCPSQSISHGERTTEPINISNSSGVLKWPMNGETCRMYPAKVKHPCDTCIAVCPYNKPYTYFHRTVRWFADHARWADPFYIKMDDVLGYGRFKDPGKFWEKWKPKKYWP